MNSPLQRLARVVAALSVGLLAGCGSDAEALPAGSGEGGAALEDDVVEAAPALARLAVDPIVALALKMGALMGEIECLEVQYTDPDAHAAAASAVLTRSDLDWARFETQRRGVEEHPAYKSTVEVALNRCLPSVIDATRSSRIALRGKLLDLEIASACLERAGRSPNERTRAMIGHFRSHGITLSQYTQEMARLSTDRDFQEKVAAGASNCRGPDPTAAGHLGDEGSATGSEASAAPGAAAVEEVSAVAVPTRQLPEDPETGLWRGEARGAKGGELEVRLEAGIVVGGTVVIGGIRLDLFGQFTEGRRLTLAGRKGHHTIQLRGRLDHRGRMSGRWSATIRREVARGSWSAKR